MTTSNHNFSKKIDIIIPVYNNVELTICCIKSIYNQISNYINQVIIHDDCSSQETNSKLNNLDKVTYPNLKVIRSEPNIGFAAGVNKASKLATAPYLLILNSDTEILGDVLEPMLNILENNSNIAAINPSGPVFSTKKINRCVLKPQKPPADFSGYAYVPAATLSGYALLIHRELFERINGFNTIYGRGYYEDTELSRVLVNLGYELAIYPTQEISHVGQSSFNQIKSNNKTKKTSSFAKELIEKNKQVYLQRFPDAAKTLNIMTLKADFNKLPEALQNQIKQITLNGGTVTLYGLRAPKNLPFFNIRFKKISLNNFLKFMINKEKAMVC